MVAGDGGGVEVGTMRLGGLFSGIGGFELAWTRAGGEVAWMCEIDRNARKVLAARFPGVPIYEDVEELDPDEVEPVDVLTGGSPCQGFSMAGARTGMLHGESRLFADYLRILNGLEKRGLKWAVWENVPGVLSIRDKETGQRTFEEVVGGLAGADGPVRLDPKRKWGAGVAAGAGRSVAWRVVDSRHFGVPQRRRRVYAAVAVGGAADNRAGRAVLAVSEGLRGDSPACVTKGQAAAGGASRGFGGAGIPDAAQCLTTGTGLRYDPETETLLPDAVGTLTSRMQGSTGWAPYNETEHLIPDQPQAFNWQSGGDMRGVDLKENTSALTTQQYGVRRLTPVECERLQAFPDGWTEPAGSDSARYKALGNAITVNVASWLFGRMMEVGE